MIGFGPGKGYEIDLDGNIVFETPPNINSVHHHITKTSNNTYFLISATVENQYCPEECNSSLPDEIPWQGDTFREFDQDGNYWLVKADGDLEIKASFLDINTGFGSKPYIPAFNGLEQFSGECHHTALWPQEGLSLTGKRVAVIGTGASGVQASQEASRFAKELTVFQRTPNLALAMQQQMLTLKDNEHMKESYPETFKSRGESFAGFGFDFIPKNATEVTAEERNKTYEELWQAGGFRYWLAVFQDTLFAEEPNRYAYDFWRDKVRERIKDPMIAE